MEKSSNNNKYNCNCQCTYRLSVLTNPTKKIQLSYLYHESLSMYIVNHAKRGDEIFITEILVLLKNKTMILSYILDLFKLTVNLFK